MKDELMWVEENRTNKQLSLDIMGTIKYLTGRTKGRQVGRHLVIR
jgi:hypothetical protein